MFNNFTKMSKSISFVLLITCFILFNNACYSQSANKWNSTTPETESDNTWLYITLGVIAVGVATYFIVKSSSGDESSAAKKKTQLLKYQNAKSDSTKVEKQDSTFLKKQNDDK